MKFIVALSSILAFASHATATVPSLGCAQAACGEPKVVAFDEFSRGDYIPFEAFQGCGISKVTCRAKTKHEDDNTDRMCRIFDTELAYGSWETDGSDPLCAASSCTLDDCGHDKDDGGYAKQNKCGDPDLVAPFEEHENPGNFLNPGKVIIYDEIYAREDYTDSQGSHAYPPDDNADGARFFIRFEKPVTINSIEFLDIEDSKTYVQFYYTDGSEKIREYVDPTGDARMRDVVYEESNVDWILVKLPGSGAISAVTFTDEETCAPTSSPTLGFDDGGKAGGGGGDPHFALWGREKYSFHGECDLVMVHSDQFQEGSGLDLHVRTKIQDYFSYIESAAVRVGSNVLEIRKESVVLDGVVFTELPLVFGDEKHRYSLHRAEVEEGKNPVNYNYYELDLDGDSSILFKFYKKFLTISIDGHEAEFGDSVGLLGDYENGNMVGRNGQLVPTAEEFGFEWQVRPEEPKLFEDDRSPQLPYERCRMPTAARPQRRKLRGALATLHEEALAACASQVDSDFTLCVEDVMATGDLGLASVW